MLVRTDDEIYRVDSVWLGPPRATFPWRARYVSYGLGLLTMIAVMFIQRRVGIGLDFFSVAWALVITVLITRFLGKRIDYERPLGQVLAAFRSEVSGPRARTDGAGGPVRSAHVRLGPVARPRGGRRADRRGGTGRPATGRGTAARSAPVRTTTVRGAGNRPLPARTGVGGAAGQAVRPLPTGVEATGRKGRKRGRRGSG